MSLTLPIMVAEISNAVPGRKHHRILALLPLRYGDQYGFWNRDVGLIVRTLRAMGYDAWLVAVSQPNHTPGPEMPVILGSMQELEDPAWWRKQKPDAIISSTWAAPIYERIREAERSLGVPIIEKLDTDGVKSPKIWFARHLFRELCNYHFSDPWPKTAMTFLRGFGRSVLVYHFPGLLDENMVKGMSRIPIFAAETPLAVARVKRYLRMFKANPMPRVVTISHPANSAEMRLLPGDKKENIIVAVGRWDDAVKGWPLLFKIAKKFAAIRPDWKIVVMGGLPKFSAETQREIDALKETLILTGRLEHQKLSEWNRRAKIYLLTSHWESFNIAATEALCCGCSVVGPSQIASSSYFASFQSGTPSYVRSPDHMTDALIAEVDEWENHRRDPEKISEAALKNFDAEMVAKSYLNLFEEMEPQAKLSH